MTNASDYLDNYYIDKVISSGQTGVDRAALDAALEHSIPCAGWCLSGRESEDGVISDDYPLKETSSSDPAERISLNVAQSDGTLVLADDGLDNDSMLTIEIAQEAAKPCLIFDFKGKGSVSDVRDWIVRDEIKILNIAGGRESTSPGIYKLSHMFLLELFGRIEK